MEKIRCAIIGPGNIGMNLLCKMERSDFLKCILFVGRNIKSKNLTLAASKGYKISADSIEALIKYRDTYDIIFDATSAESHRQIYQEIQKYGKYIIDLTPSKIGELCVPCLNGEECLNYDNLNMVTCGGQSLVPIAYAISRVCDNIKYFESVSTIASLSAGIATRENIDDYIETTEKALRKFTGVDNVKAMLIINPSEPPILMRNTLYTVVENPNMDLIIESVKNMEKTLLKYVPGFKVVVKPVLVKEGTIATTIEIKGTGDFLPEYSGNLDIITCAAIEMAEKYAIKLMRG